MFYFGTCKNFLKGVFYEDNNCIKCHKIFDIWVKVRFCKKTLHMENFSTSLINIHYKQKYQFGDIPMIESFIPQFLPKEAVKVV